MSSGVLAQEVRRPKPSVGWPVWTLVVIAVWAAALGVLDAEWTDQDMIYLYAALVSLVLSAILVQIRIQGRSAALILGLAGVLSVGDSVAHFAAPVLIEQDWDESGTRLLTLGQRLASWGAALVGGQPEENPVAFLFVSGMLMWGCTAWALWCTIRRGRPLLAMFPLAGVLATSTYLSGGSIGYLLGFVACLTLLLPLVCLRRQEWRWERMGVDYSPEIRFDVWQVAVVVTLVVFVLSLLTPSFNIPRAIRSFWQWAGRLQRRTGGLLTRFFGRVELSSLPEGRTVPPGEEIELPEALLPRAHLLGGNPALSRQLVMWVCTDAPPPVPEELLSHSVPSGPRYYWRGTTYDTFDGRSWTNGPSASVMVPAYDPVSSSGYTRTVALRQRYLIQVPHANTLYAAGEPSWVDQPVRSRRRAEDDLVGLEGKTQDYTVWSYVPQATAGQLDAALGSYPDRITSRYLGLPEPLPGRVRALATEVVVDVDSAYGKAVAIERYLRQFPYDLQIAPPPPGRDVVDHFLFDVQRGYCDYYASSFVVLARLVGLPARLAVGYAMGEYDLDRGCYAVTEMDAHAWPQVYFPAYGWIPFEPTASFSPLHRPQDARLPLERVPPVPKRPRYLVVREWWQDQRWATYIALAGGVASMALSIAWARRRRRASRSLPSAKIALCYEALCQLGQRLGTMRRPYDTPAEYGALLTAAIQARTVRWPWSGRRLALVSARSGDRVRDLSLAYEWASYRPRPPDRSDQNEVERLWRRLRWDLWVLWCTSRRCARSSRAGKHSGPPERTRSGSSQTFSSTLK